MGHTFNWNILLQEDSFKKNLEQNVLHIVSSLERDWWLIVFIKDI